MKLKAKLKAIAESIATNLLTPNGEPEAHRLAIMKKSRGISGKEIEMGGWGKPAVVDLIIKELEDYVIEDYLSEDPPVPPSEQDTGFPSINILRIWDQAHREEEVVCGNGRVWKITDLHEAVKNEPVYQIPLAFIDLSAHKFDDDGGLLAFAMHMRHVNETNTDHPIIVDQWGKILDGRHRIVKALLEGRTTIGAKKVPDHTSPTYYKPQ